MFAVVTTLHWNELVGITLAIALVLFVTIGLVVTRPKR